MIKPYYIKEIVEDLLAIKYQGRRLKEFERDSFEKEYKEKFK
jgi:hypothetical protein